MNKRELEDAIREEVAEWPGVTVDFVHGGNHPKAKLMFGGEQLFRAFGGNQSFAVYPHKMIADMRDVMRQLGATRKEPEPTQEAVEQRYRKRNEAGVAARPHPVAADPATPRPDIADQLVEAGAATPAQADAARTSRAEPTIRVVNSLPYAAEELADDPDEDRARQLAEIQAQIDAIEDGVYFDLPDAVYHGVRALGSGSLCDLIVSPGTFWRGSWLDPDRPELDEEQTEAQLTGKAYHVARLQPELFEQLFVRELDKGDFPKRGFLSSDEKVKAALKALGCQQTVSGETTAERAGRLLDAGYEGTIFPLEKALWESSVEGRTPLKAKVWDEISRDMERLRASEEIAEKLSGGFAEVSVFWRDRHGLRCKARIDYLKVDLWDDFKTFDNSKGKVLAQAIADAFRFNRYYVQAVHYRDAIEAIRVGGLQIRGEASDEQRALIAAIQIRPDELDCWYLFQEKKGIPNLIGRRFEFFAVPVAREHEIRAMVEEGRHDEVRAMMTRLTSIHQLGRAEIEQAKRTFALYSQIYPPGVPWAPIEPLGTIGDLDFNSYWLEGKA